jgi:hypothetical protein
MAAVEATCPWAHTGLGEPQVQSVAAAPQAA